MLTFVSSNKERIWLFKYFDISGIQKDVMVKKYRIFSGANGRRILSWDIKATEAAFIPGKGWTFRDGLLTEYTKDGFMPLSPKKFKEYSKNLEELPETPEEIMNAVKPPEDLPVWTIWKILNNTKDMDPKCRNVYSTIFYYRIAFPWACFLAVFLGVPLAAKNERAGIFQSIIIAIVVIVVYQMASEIFLVLGKRGLLPAIFAGLFPTLAFIGYGWYNIVRQQS
jgi:lipopolysaccharide export LptBFGC system permease protein LptF